MPTSFSFKTEQIALKKQRLKILFLLISFMICVLLFFSTLSGNAIKLYEKYFVNDHHEVLSYIEKIDRYNRDSTEIVDRIRLELYRTNQGEYSNDVRKAKEELQQVVNQAVTLSPPRSFVQHKNLLIAVLHQQIIVLTTYNNTKKTYVFDKLKTSVGDLNQKQDLERKALLKALNKEGINYKQLGDGSIRYWYKSHSAKSLKEDM
jgi:hypothetical protein